MRIGLNSSGHNRLSPTTGNYLLYQHLPVDPDAPAEGLEAEFATAAVAELGNEPAPIAGSDREREVGMGVAAEGLERDCRARRLRHAHVDAPLKVCTSIVCD